LQTRALEADKMQQAITLENNLNVLLGRYPQHIQRSDTLLTEKQLALVSIGVPAQLILNRPDIMEAEKKLLANEAQVKSARASFYPGLHISAFLALNGFNAAYFFNPVSAAYALAGSVAMPLLNRKQLMKDYWLKAADKKEAFLHYQQIVLTGVSEVGSWYNRMLSYQHISDLKQQEVTELTTATDIANDLFLTGYANYLEVLTVRRNVLDAEIQLTESRREFFLAYINLYKAMGGGWQ
jgi:outer membrane protein, multidrug efflux system